MYPAFQSKNGEPKALAVFQAKALQNCVFLRELGGNAFRAG
jgi:hypothetical protein